MVQREEVEAIVADYLLLSLSSPARTTARPPIGALQARLNQRSGAPSEFKHSNISAVMIEECSYPTSAALCRLPMSRPCCAVVQEQLASMTWTLALAAVRQPVVALIWTTFLPSSPRRRNGAVQREPARTYAIAVKRGLRREAQNQFLGAAGEEFVLRYGTGLRQQASPRSPACGARLSRSRGDGLGYDILSFEADGHERSLEVKTTNFGKKHRFFVSRGELQFSATRAISSVCRLLSSAAPRSCSADGPTGAC
ncbi:MAG: DUF3883 domain-containing protein [Burkholderiaceae bacterium]